MKNYRITVNGVSYDVCVEELSGATAPAPVSAAAPVAAPAAPAPAPAAPVAGTAVKAPMPGTIVRVNAKVGDVVKKGDVLLVLEAMKMENDVCAPAAGTVKAVHVAQGASVVSDEALVTIA